MMPCKFTGLSHCRRPSLKRWQDVTYIRDRRRSRSRGRCHRRHCRVHHRCHRRPCSIQRVSCAGSGYTLYSYQHEHLPGISTSVRSSVSASMSTSTSFGMRCCIVFNHTRGTVSTALVCWREPAVYIFPCLVVYRLDLAHHFGGHTCARTHA